MKWVKRLLGIEEETNVKTDPTNYDYVCVPQDPIRTVKDLRVGLWNMAKLQEAMAMGMLRYATESEVAEAKRNGRLVEKECND